VPDRLASMKARDLGRYGGDLVFDARFCWRFAGNQIRLIRDGFYGLPNLKEAEDVILRVLDRKPVGTARPSLLFGSR